MKIKKLKSDICISVEKSGVRILFFTFKNKILDIKCDYFLKNRLEAKIFLENKSKLDYIEKIKKSIISNSIKYNIEEYGRVYINLQEPDIMLRNIMIDPDIKDEMLIRAAELEINEYIPNAKRDYIIKFRDIEKEKEFKCVRTVFFPNKYRGLYEILCDDIKPDKKYISVNFDILGKLLHESGDIKGKRVYIECRREDLVVSRVNNKKITESYVINIDEINISVLNDILSGTKEVYMYGINSSDIKEKFSLVSELKEPDFDHGISVNSNTGNNSISEYLNLVGVLI